MQEDSISIPIALITEFLAKAPPFYVSVYLLARALPQADASLLAKQMHANVGDVRHALGYWQEKGLLAPSAQPSSDPCTKRSMDAPPNYSVEEMQLYLERYDWVRQLKQSAEKHLDKFLSYQELSTLFSFYDWLGMSPEVIELLLAYCTYGDKKRGMRYIEKVALSWHEEGIDTVEKALEYIKLRQEGVKKIMAAFGQSSRTPVPAEETYLKRWLKEFALPVDIICEACRRTVLQSGKVSFPYANKILSDWKQAGVKTMQDIEALDAAFSAKKSLQQQKQTNDASAKKPNRFLNYDQRDWDFQELERLENERRKQW